VTPAAYCEERAAPPGSALHYAVRTLAPARRRAVVAIHAFSAEARAAVADPREREVAGARLAWWREELRRAFDGSPQHPAAQALADAVREHSLAKEPFQQMLDGAELELAADRFPDTRSVGLFLHLTGGVPAQLAAQVCGYRERGTLRHAAELGQALALARILAELGADLQRGRRYLPRDLLARHGVTERDLVRAAPAAEPLVRDEIARALAMMAAAEALLPSADRRAQRPGLALLAMERALLREILRDPLQVLRSRVALTPLRRLWIAWKTATFAR
jgi:phytoene synthase